MNDIASPLLVALGDEALTFWCFAEALQLMRSKFLDLTLSPVLSVLSSLVQYSDPPLYSHLENILDGASWTFCYRWVLLNFKRELPMESTIFLWERIWSQHWTSDFDLFLVGALLTSHRQHILAISQGDMLHQFSQDISSDLDVGAMVKAAQALLWRIKNDEHFCPRELMPLVQCGQAAPPPMVGFVRSRQSFSSRHIGQSNSNTHLSLMAESGVLSTAPRQHHLVPSFPTHTSMHSPPNTVPCDHVDFPTTIPSAGAFASDVTAISLQPPPSDVHQTSPAPFNRPNSSFAHPEDIHASRYSSTSSQDSSTSHRPPSSSSPSSVFSTFAVPPTSGFVPASAPRLRCRPLPPEMNHSSNWADSIVAQRSPPRHGDSCSTPDDLAELDSTNRSSFRYFQFEPLQAQHASFVACPTSAGPGQPAPFLAMPGNNAHTDHQNLLPSSEPQATDSLRSEASLSAV